MKKNVRTIVVLVIFILFVIGVFTFFSKKETKLEDPQDVEATVMDELLGRNLDINYPPTPREVLKYYNEITQEIYKETYSDEQLSEIAKRLRLLYDDELVENQPFDEYLNSLKGEIKGYLDKGITISSYTLSSSTDVETYTVDGFDFAKLYTFYNLRQEQNGTVAYQQVNQVFVLRKDAEDGHWKIYGFQLASDEK